MPDRAAVDAKGRQSSTKIDLAYEYIKERIVTAELKPGERLVLDRLAGVVGVSHAPVREALRRLQAQGFVSYEHNAGARVAVLDRQAYADRSQIIAALEGAATSASAPLITPSDLDAARELNMQMRRAREALDAELFMEINEQFHDLLCAPCPNPLLREALAHQRDLVVATRAPALAAVLRESLGFIEEHDRLIHLIETDPTSSEIVALIHEHKMRLPRVSGNR